MGILDRFLDVGASMDGITPLLSLSGQAAGATRIVNVPADLAYDIEAALQADGFAVLRPAFTDDRFIFDVPRTQYDLVLQLLRRFGLEFE